jgi:pilus assembly protein CpaE
VSRKDFEHSLERKVDIVLPFAPKTAAQAAKPGQPLAKVSKTAKLSQPLNQLLALTVEQAGAEGAEEASPRSGGSLLGKLGNFRALVAKKPKEASATA